MISSQKLLTLSILLFVPNAHVSAQPQKPTSPSKLIGSPAGGHKKPKAPQCTVPPRQTSVSLANVQPLTEYPPITQRVYQAAKNYNEDALGKILNAADRQSQEKMLMQAVAYADYVKHDAQTSRSLVEALMQTRKSWFERHYRLTTLLTPVAAAMTAAVIYVLVYKLGHGPKGNRPSANGSKSSISQPLPVISRGSDENY